MRYLEIEPEGPLRSLIRCFWFLSGSGEPGSPAEAALPDGRPELLLNFGAPFLDRSEPGEERPQPRAILVGQITRPILVAPSGPIDLVAVRFESSGAGLLWREMSALTDRWLPVEELDLPALATLWEEVGDAPTSRDRAVLLEERFARLLLPGLERSPMAAAVAAIRESRGRVSITDLAAELNTTRRHLERRFADQVGISPKMLARIVRFQRVFRALGGQPDGWATVAARCGYYDQSHLVRDFRDFTGTTPTAFTAADGDFTRLFLER